MVKLKEGNYVSRVLFERLGFQQKGEVNYFGEVILMMFWDEIICKKWWNEVFEDFKEVVYL